MAARRRRPAQSSLHSKNRANTAHFKRAKCGSVVRLARLSACLRPRRRRAFPRFPRSLPRFSRSPVRTRSLMIAPYIHIFIKPNMRPRRGLRHATTARTRACDYGADSGMRPRRGLRAKATPRNVRHQATCAGTSGFFIPLAEIRKCDGSANGNRKGDGMYGRPLVEGHPARFAGFYCLDRPAGQAGRASRKPRPSPQTSGA